MKALAKLIIAAPLLAMAGACNYSLGGDEAVLDGREEAPETATTFGSGPEKVWLEKAKENFRNGEYGLAERYYRQAVEERRNKVEAWLGLAASYDHLKRFDEADRAYKVVTKMAGHTPAVLNNLGYHYMLKGDFAAAERTLLEAQEKDPANPFIKNNLVLLYKWKAGSGNAG